MAAICVKTAFSWADDYFKWGENCVAYGVHISVMWIDCAYILRNAFRSENDLSNYA